MPIDFRVMAKGGKQYDFHIPNTWFVKKTDATVLPKWYGWDKLHPTYTCTITIPSGIEDVIIDPTYRLADVYMPDNTKKCDAEWNFDSQVANLADWKHYQLNWRPDLWYNAVDGLKIGLHLDGNYFQLKNKFSLTAWFNSTLLQNGIPNYDLEQASFDSISPVSFNFSYSSNTHRFIKNSTVDVAAKFLDGMWGGSAGFSIQANSKNTISCGVKSMYRAHERDLNYLLYPDQWIAGNWNNSVSLALDHKYVYFKGNGDINVALRSASLFSDYQYADITMTTVNKNKLGKFDINTRVIGRIGTDDPAPESALYLAGGSPEEMMDNKFVRSKAFVPDDWLGYGADINHFQQGGGLNLRGFAGYVVAEKNSDDEQVYELYKGNTGAAFNGELEFDNLVKLRPKFSRNWLHLDSYVFADVGTIGYRNNSDQFFLSALRADAGLGIALTIKKWGPLDKVKPLVLRADFPLLINRIPDSESGYFKFRYVVGIGRAF
jgi:aminopeptidase N